MLYFTEGGGEVILDGARLTAVAPSLLLIPAQTVHGFAFDPSTNGTVVTAAQGPLESVAHLLMPELVTLVRKPALIPLDADNVHAKALMPLFLAIERETQRVVSLLTPEELGACLQRAEELETYINDLRALVIRL